MANYVGIVYNNEADNYGADPFMSNNLPQFYLKNDGQSPDLNVQEFDDEDVRNGLDEYRNGYPEPEGEVTLTAHTKSAPTIFYGLLGNYKFTQTNETNDDNERLNIHEFWQGENMERPQWAGEFAYSDFFLKRIFGAVMDSLEWSANLDKTTATVKFLYRDEAVKKIFLEQYKHNFSILKALGLVGYDYHVNIGQAQDNDYVDSQGNTTGLTSSCFKELTITVENNHAAGEDARCLGQYTYGFKPTMETCNIELEAVTKFDRRNYEFIVGAMHNGFEPNQDGWDRLKVCKTFNKRVYLKAQSCLDPDEYIEFIFPKCRVTLDPIDGDSNRIEATLKLKPFTNQSITLNDGSTGKRTGMYVRVCTTAPRVAPDTE